jgi:4-hydroxy-2-oxoheptanedioate aldolase
MRENRVRTIWAEGGAVINGWLAIPSGFSAETMAHQGWDSLTVDLQHGLVDYATALPMLQGISTTDTIPMARVPWLDPGIIMKLLDAGCYGIICPMVNSRADAEALVGACRYPPAGYRSFGPARAMLYAGADYAQHANDTVVPFAMIETAEALENLDDILTTPGLDAIYIGPSDLGLALGCEAKLDQTEPKVVEAIDHILASAKRHGVTPGIHCLTAEYARDMIGKGFQLVTVGSDSRLMAAAAGAAIKTVRGG